MHCAGHSRKETKMSVTATTHRGKRVWLVQVIRNGGSFNRRRYLCRRTYRKSDALEAEKQLLAEYEALQSGGLCNSNHHIGVFTATPQKPPTFATFARRFLNLQDPERPDTRNKRRNIERHLIPFFGATPLPRVSRMMIDEFCAKLRRKPKAASRKQGGAKCPKTINNILTTLRTILNLAYEYELIDRVPRIKKEKVPKQDPEFLSFKESEKLLAATPDEWKALVDTAILTGLRRGELMELRWGDLHFKTRKPYIRVSRGLDILPGPVYRPKETKGGRARSVPMTPKLLRRLTEYRPRTAMPEDLVFAEQDGSYLRVKRFYNVVVQAGQDAGLKKHVRPHILRHTFASRAYQRGVPPQRVQKWLGHASITTTERYAHLAEEAGDALIDTLDEPDLQDHTEIEGEDL